MRLTVLIRALLLLPVTIGWAQAAIAQSASPILEPSTPWNIDYADNECRLLRTFGTGDQAITLRLARGGNTGTIDTVIAGSGIPKLPTRVLVEVTFEPQKTTQSTSGYSMSIPNGSGRFVRWYDFKLSMFDQAGANQIVQFASGKAFATRLNLLMVHQALKALDSCYADLLKSWGVGLEDVAFLMEAQNRSSNGSTEIVAHRLDLPKPKSSPGAWVTSFDYPTEALVKEQSGDVTVALILGTDGRPTRCQVVVSSKVAVLDLATCKNLQARASYTPPLDAAGKPRPSVRIERVRWRVPDSDW